MVVLLPKLPFFSYEVGTQKIFHHPSNVSSSSFCRPTTNVFGCPWRMDSRLKSCSCYLLFGTRHHPFLETRPIINYSRHEPTNQHKKILLQQQLETGHHVTHHPKCNFCDFFWRQIDPSLFHPKLPPKKSYFFWRLAWLKKVWQKVWRRWFIFQCVCFILYRKLSKEVK